jgi:cysteine desulfuration protein SufE
MAEHINDIQDSIIGDFELFDEWLDKYQYIIDLGKELPLIEEDEKIDERLISGCQSRVWLKAEHVDSKLIFSADSDAIITKGIIALLIRVLSQQPPSDIINANLYFIDRIGLNDHLSPTRANGLLQMVNQMKRYGIAYTQD